MGHKMSLSEEFVSCVWLAHDVYTEMIRQRQRSRVESAISISHIATEMQLVGHSNGGRLGYWESTCGSCAGAWGQACDNSRRTFGRCFVVEQSVFPGSMKDGG